MAETNQGYTIDQLAAAAGVTRRAIRFWVMRGALPKPRFRGRSTLYPPAFVARIHALHALQRQGLELREIRRQLDNATPEEIAKWGASAASAPVAPAAPPPPASAPDLVSGLHAERWQRVALLPGLELHVRDGSGPLITAIASEIATRYAARG